MEREQCVFKQWNQYSANLDYNCEDVGVIPHTAQQELMMSIQNDINLPSEDEIEELQIEAHVSGRVTRTPRELRTSQAKQNLFSRKFDEVKAAVKGPIKNLSKYIKDIRFDAYDIESLDEFDQIYKVYQKFRGLKYFNFMNPTAVQLTDFKQDFIAKVGRGPVSFSDIAEDLVDYIDNHI